MLSQFKQTTTPRAGQAPRRVRRLAAADQVRSAITSVGPDYVVDSQGHYCAVLRLLGSEIGVVDEQVLCGRLKTLADYLQRAASPIQRISSSYLQPLGSYLAYLEGCLMAALEYAPGLAEPLTELAGCMEDARERFQARLGADYWVVTYAPGGSALPGRGRRVGGAPPSAAAGAAEEEAPPGHGLRGRLQRAQSAARARALQELNEQCALVASTLQHAEIQTERLHGPALAALFAATWGQPEHLPPPAALEAGEDVPTAEAVAQQICAPAGAIEFTARWAHTEGGYVRSWYVRDFGETLSSGLVSRLAQTPGVKVLQYCEQVPTAEARRVLRLNRTITTSEQYMRPQRDVPDYDFAAKVQSNDEVRAGIAFHGDAVFRYRAIIQQWASSEEELEERSRALLLALQDHAQIVAHQATFQQEGALLSGLPLGHCRIHKPERNLDANSLAYLFYPSARDPLQPTGVWLGMALPSRLLVTMDLFKLQNPVVELVGIMGSGKSMTQKFLLTQLVAQGYPGFVLDGAREYISTVEALGGQVIRLGSTHGPAFNPVHFDPLDENEEGDPFIVGQALFLDWVEAALHSLSDLEKTVAGEAYMRALARKGIQHDDRATWEQSRPLLSDVYAALFEEPADPQMGLDNPQVVARKLALALKPFALGVYAPLFNRPDQFVLGTERLICFDVYDVPDRLRLAFVHQLLAFIQRQTLRRYRYRGSVVVLDEGHLLLHDERSARILEHLVRNGRKAGQLMLFTQHTHTDSQRNHSAELAHKTAGATLVFRINRQDVATLDDLHLSDLEKQIVVEQHEGECLLVAPSGHLQLKVVIPPEWYTLFTTKPDEVLAQQRHDQQPEVSLAAPPQPDSDLAPQAPLPAVAWAPADPVRTEPAEVSPPAPPAQINWEEMNDVQALWEEALVGENQVAPEWLRAGLPAYDQRQRSNAEEDTARRSPSLQLIWSRRIQRDDEQGARDDKGGGVYQPDQGADGQAPRRA